MYCMIGKDGRYLGHTLGREPHLAFGNDLR